MTLDLYGHLYEDDLGALSDALDHRHHTATNTPRTRLEQFSRALSSSGTRAPDWLRLVGDI